MMQHTMINKLPLIRHSKGLSLLEMMISVALGMVIILGLMSVYLSSQKSAGVRTAISEMESNARGALAGIRQTVEHAGYPSIYNIPLEKPFHTLEDGPIDVATRCRKGTEKLVKPNSIKNKFTKDSGTRDHIVVKYMADNRLDPNAEIITDCTGGIVPSECSADPDAGMYDPIKAVVYNALYITSKHVLTCAGSRNTVPQPIAVNISYMQFLYGVTANAGTRYLTATQIEASKEWESVISVQVAILVRSDADVLETTTPRRFFMLNKKLTRNDKRLYRIYSTTINLPNRNRRVL